MLTATHINYYHVCHRKLWLFSNGIQMEHTSETVQEGKLIGATIRRGASIGANAVILPGIEIGRGALVGSGSVVTKDVAPGALAVARGRQMEKAGWAAHFTAAQKARKDSQKK